MKKQKSAGSIGQLLAAMTLMAGGFGQAAEAASSFNQATQQTTVPMKKSKVVIQGNLPVVVRESKRNSHGQRAYAHKKVGFLDQKSKRQKLRNNASFGRSKKCTTKR
jgi:hypothetical protein